MPTIEGRNYSLNEIQRLWAPLYHNRETQLGATATLINFGDQRNWGKVDATTGTGAKFHANGLSPVWTPSEALSAFATPFDLKLAANWQGIIPVLTLNGTDEEMDSPDAAYWSRAGAVFSVGAWVNMTDATSSMILSKTDTAGNTREWEFGMDANDVFYLYLMDESEVNDPYLLTVSTVAVDQGRWTFLVATYDGTANASGMNLYRDGVLVASTDTDQAGFISLEDLGGTVKFGHTNATPIDMFDGKMAGGPVSPFFVQAELTAAQVANLYRVERLALGV